MGSIKKSLKSLLRNRISFLVFLFVLVATFVVQTAFATKSENTETDYVSSEKCKECHEKEYKGWQNTLHSTVVQDAKKDPSVILGDFSVERADVFAEKYGIDFTVGSHWKQRYLTKIKGDYYALPIVWSVITKSWDDYSVSFWNRKPYSKFCIGCHTTNYNPNDKSFTEHSIGCEACHGPGKKHIMSEGDAKLIVNPAKLSDERRDMVCAACHVRGADLSQKYKFPIGFKPGEDLAEYMFMLKGEDETTKDAILKEYAEWKKNRKSPKECDVCGINRPDPSTSTHEGDESSTDFCFGCHNFKDKFSEHTRHSEEVDIICNDCHKIVAKTDGKEEKVERNIHSYDYYLVHNVGCYDPYIEKYCIKCHKDKTKDWATALVIDWAIPPDFIHNE